MQQFAELNLGVNVTQFTAQRFEAEMVTLVRDMAYSTDVSHETRLRCAVQVAEWARGKVDSWYHTKETLDPDDRTITGETIGETIEAARVTAERFGRLDDLVRRKVAYEDWPEDIKALSEAAAFADLDQ